MKKILPPLAKEIGDLKQRTNVMVALKKCHWSRSKDYVRRQGSLMRADLLGLKTIHGRDFWCTNNSKDGWVAGIRLVILHAGAEIDREIHVAILLTA